jgi:membrane protein
VDLLQLETVFQTLATLDWVGKLDELEDGTGPSQHESRYVLLADLDTTLLAPLAERLLLAESLRLENLWESSRLRSMYLREVL